MKKIILVLFSALFLTSAANAADITFGVSAAYTKVNASGTETESTEKTNASVSNEAVIGSLFIENNFGGYSLGIDYIPGKADVSNKLKSRTDSNTDGDTGTNKAQAEVSNHISIYALVPFADKYFLKAGAVQMDVTTKESLNSGSTYGNDSIMGGLVGLGVQNGNFRIALEYTDYEQLSLTSQTNSDNKITADLDTTAVKVSYSF